MKRTGRSIAKSAAKTPAARKGVAAAALRAENPAFAICVRNDDYPASLELRKLYPVLDDAFASEHGFIFSRPIPLSPSASLRPSKRSCGK
jgi:hypothetical protein